MTDSQTVIAAFSEDQAEQLTGVTKSQLRYWDKTNFYKPSFAEENRRVAFSRVYSFKDIVALRVLSALRNQYSVSLQYLRDVSTRLSCLGPDPDRWAGTRLYAINKRVIWHELGTDLPQEIITKQYLIPISLETVIKDTEKDIEKGKAPRDQSNIGLIKRSRYVIHNTPAIAGTRIPANAIKRFSEAGYTVEQIIHEYPDLTEQDIVAALNFQQAPSAA